MSAVSFRVVLLRVTGLASFAIATGLLTWATGTPASCLASLRESTGGAFDELMPAVAGAVAWCALLWFMTVVAVELAATWPGRAGQLGSRLAARLGPTSIRTVARWLVGISLVATPLSSVTAVASAATDTTPNLDRPVASAMATPAAIDLDRPRLSSAPTTPLVTPATELPREAPTALGREPATSLRREPGTPYIAPAPPPPVKVAAADGAPLLTGTPHRDTDDQGGYVVRRGDALWNIAARHLGPGATAADIAREWPRWYAANRAVIGSDPSLLRPGELLHAPPA